MNVATIYRLRVRISAMRAQLEDMDRMLELMLPSAKAARTISV